MSKRGVFTGSGGVSSSTPTPGSRNGRAMPSTTPQKLPFGKARASFSSMLPSVGAVATRRATETRMPSSGSSWSTGPFGSVIAAVISTGAGSALPLLMMLTTGPVSSVMKSWCGLDEERYSSTVPDTRTRSPTATVGAPPVNTRMPSEVAASASSWPGTVCRKKALLKRRAVTMPSTATRSPSRGDRRPEPWTSWMPSSGASTSVVSVAWLLAGCWSNSADETEAVVLRVPAKASLTCRSSTTLPPAPEATGPAPVHSSTCATTTQASNRPGAAVWPT